VRATSGIELSRVRTEFRLRPPEPINQSPLESRGRHCYAIKSNHSWVLVFLQQSRNMVGKLLNIRVKEPNGGSQIEDSVSRNKQS
jgi:hypothetical protein